MSKIITAIKLNGKEYLTTKDATMFLGKSRQQINNYIYRDDAWREHSIRFPIGNRNDWLVPKKLVEKKKIELEKIISNNRKIRKTV